jgi:hypothetical protein
VFSTSVEVNKNTICLLNQLFRLGHFPVRKLLVSQMVFVLCKNICLCKKHNLSVKSCEIPVLFSRSRQENNPVAALSEMMVESSEMGGER